ncbi:MAG: hypothetical protein LBJ24_02295 [Treponema sp.]|jgi:TatD DNase family protein|nr:hypothetical protein [Treponema sp.]
MASDAHAHPFDLAERFPGAEEERCRLGIRCAASAWNREQFVFHEGLSRAAAAAGAPQTALCFGVHPQLPAETGAAEKTAGHDLEAILALLAGLAGEGRLNAVGEAGFDLFNPFGV